VDESGCLKVRKGGKVESQFILRDRGNSEKEIIEAACENAKDGFRTVGAAAKSRN